MMNVNSNTSNTVVANPTAHNWNRSFQVSVEYFESSVDPVMTSDDLGKLRRSMRIHQRSLEMLGR